MQYENKYNVIILSGQGLVLEVHLFHPFAKGAKYCGLAIVVQIRE